MKHTNLRRKVTCLRQQLAPQHKPKVYVHAWVPPNWKGSNPDAHIQIIPANREATES